MARPEVIQYLKETSPLVLPSLLLCDFGNLNDEVDRLRKAGVRALHLDVMDGHFVPNLTYGMPIVAGLRRLTEQPLDVHLMISRPERYLKQFAEAGADVITVHVEACQEPDSVLKQIRQQGVAAGIALNPATPLRHIEPCLDLCDLVLVMSVEAGFGGQSFDGGALEKLSQLREHVGAEMLLEVDGGINDATISDCAKAGADLLVVGSAIFKSHDYTTAVGQLTELAASGHSGD